MGDPTDAFDLDTCGRCDIQSPEIVPASSNGNNPRSGVFAALIVCAAVAPALSSAAPLVFEETAKISSPDPSFQFPLRVAVEGDTIIATGRRFEGEIEHHAVFLFERQPNGDWAYLRTLAEGSCNSGEGAEDTCNAAVGIRNGLAVAVAGEVHVLERSATGAWIAAPTDGYSGPGDAAVGTDTVLTSESNSCAWESQAFRKNSAGVWTVVATMPGLNLPCDPWGLFGSDVDMSAGNRVIVGISDFDEDVEIYEPNSSGWTQTATLTSPVSSASFGDRVAMDDSRAFVSGALAGPIHVFTGAAGGWTHSTDIVPPDAARLGPPRALKVRDLVVAGFANDPHRGGSVGVFQETASGQYEQVARLVASGSGQQDLFLGWDDVDASVNGSFARIVATGGGAVYVFDLDDWGTTAPLRQETFESGNAASWIPMAGSSFSVVTSGGTSVYRQSSVAGDAGSFVTSTDWTDQAIEADVKPTAFNGAGRWVGLAVRRTDANNYYYLTLRQTNVLEIKRIVNGTFVTLAATPMPVTLNRTYRLRLEAIGTLIRAYVDGRLAAEADDTQLTHGHAGVRMYKASADFDNVILSQNPHLELLDSEDGGFNSDLWSFGPGEWNDGPAYYDGRLVQTDISGDARAVMHIDAQNQIVQVRASADTFAAGTGSRWFGVLARYRDAGNYYYVTVRSDNTISLRKLLNGAIHVLDTAPLSVSIGTPYTLRLDAVGDSLRTYVNGNLVLEANDSSHANGRYGIVMYKAAAAYEDFVVWEP